MSSAAPRDLSRAAGQVLVAGFAGRDAPGELLGDVRRGLLGGIILFRRNLGAPAEVAGLIARFAEAAPVHMPLLVAVDQEGGRVARLGPPVLRLPPMRRLGEVDDPSLTRSAAAALGRQLAALGITCDFAPVLDVDTNPDNPVIGDRSFGPDPEVVIRHGLAFAAGLADAGLLACAKHFPGHGDTDVDSHLALPRLSHGRERIEEVELAPFRAARGHIPALMTAHVIFEALDADLPATLSRAVVTDLLRAELGYEGLVISDDLEMKAVSEGWGVAGAACRAIDAGCDMLLVCSRLDLLVEARVALTRRAHDDERFARRLREAARRAVATRRRAPPAPLRDPEQLSRALGAREVEALEAELLRRTGA